MNDVIIVDKFGNTLTYTQEQIVSPKYECDGCYKPEEYVHRIAEYGLTTVEADANEGTYTYTHLLPECMCTVQFTDQCN